MTNFLEISVPASEAQGYIYPNGAENRTYVVHQEPSQAQKAVNDDDPPGPHPWWAASTWESGSFSGGPYPDCLQAIQAVLQHADQA